MRLEMRPLEKFQSRIGKTPAETIHGNRVSIPRARTLLSHLHAHENEMYRLYGIVGNKRRRKDVTLIWEIQNIRQPNTVFNLLTISYIMQADLEASSTPNKAIAVQPMPVHQPMAVHPSTFPNDVPMRAEEKQGGVCCDSW